jgi:WD40 repeat protein
MIAVHVLDSRINLVTEETGELVLSIDSPNDEDVYDVEFSPDNSLIYAENGENKYYAWDVKTGQLSREFEECRQLRFSPTSPEIAFIRNNELIVQSLTTDEVMTRRTFDAYLKLAYTPDGTRIVCAHDNNNITVYDRRDLSIITTTLIVPGEIEKMDCTAAGDYVLINLNIRGDQALFVLRTKDLTVCKIDWDQRQRSYYKSVLKTGNAYFVSAPGRRSEYHVYDLDTDTKTDLPHNRDFYPSEVSEDRKYVYGTSDGQTVKMNIETGEVRVVYEDSGTVVLMNPGPQSILL